MSGADLIRVERGKEVKPGVWEYSIPSLCLSGKSRQPLLDACRQIKRALGPTKAAGVRAGVYRPGHTEPDISCLVLDGAELTVSEPSRGNIKFVRFQEFDAEAVRLRGRTNIGQPPFLPVGEGH
jgi:hypothetical protein